MNRTRTWTLLLALIPAWTSLAAAQEQAPEGEGEVEETGPQAADDPPDLDEAYRRAMDAFVSDDWAAAAAGFEDVAARTVEPARRAAATELASEARRRAEAEAAPRGEVLTTPPPAAPEGYGETPPPVPPAPGEAPEPQRLAQEEQDEARGELIAGTTVLGLGLWGWATPVSLGAKDTKLIVGTYMVIAAGSFFVPFLLTQDAVVTPGEATLALAFGTEGVLIGSLLYGVVTAYDVDDALRGLAGTMTLTSLAGTVGGYAWASLTDMDDGTAHAIYTGLLFGGAWALGLELLVEGDSWGDGGDGRIRGNLAGILAGAGLGVLGGKLLADARTYTWGDVELVQTAGIVGTYLGLVPVILGELDDPRIAAPLLMLGSLGGLFAGDLMVDGVDLTDGQAWLVNTGAYVGGLIGAGVAFLASSDDFDATDAKVMVTLSAATAVGGGALTYHLIDPRPEGGEAPPPPVSLHLAPSFAADQDGRLAPGAVLAGTF